MSGWRGTRGSNASGEKPALSGIGRSEEGQGRLASPFTFQSLAAVLGHAVEGIGLCKPLDPDLPNCQFTVRHGASATIGMGG